ncbi:MAG TPA: hypothetical protein VFF06_26500 [Polyangia bacterium]|nr:hypothetical protein [Polyangia bacterium]
MGMVQDTEYEWVAFPGGELEGQTPKALCPACRAALKRAATAPSASTPEPEHRRTSTKAPGHSGTLAPRRLCFACYRAELDRRRALSAAGELDTATEARFQYALPFEPVNTSRLAALKFERAAARDAARDGTGVYVERRRRAQIDARHALHAIVAGIHARHAPAALRDRLIASATRAAELQLPDAWLPFVVSR